MKYYVFRHSQIRILADHAANWIESGFVISPDRDAGYELLIYLDDFRCFFSDHAAGFLEALRIDPKTLTRLSDSMSYGHPIEHALLSLRDNTLSLITNVMAAFGKNVKILSAPGYSEPLPLVAFYGYFSWLFSLLIRERQLLDRPPAKKSDVCEIVNQYAEFLAGSEPRPGPVTIVTTDALATKVLREIRDMVSAPRMLPESIAPPTPSEMEPRTAAGPSQDP